MNNNLFGYDHQNTWIHRLSGSSKLFFFLLVSIIAMVSYDTRFICLVLVLSLVLLQQSHIKWAQIRLVVKLIVAFSLLNLVMIYIFSPENGVAIYGTKHVIFGSGFYALTQEQLFYEINLALKYFVTVPLALIFLITTNPSEFAASLNRLGVSYRISYSVSLALRYIPDVQNDYQEISRAQQARGYEISKKGKLMARLTGAVHIIMPLIFTSIAKIDTISQAMELRRFGRNKKRSWYMQRPMTKNDDLVWVATIVIVIIGGWFFHIDGSRFFNPFK
ncbi:energy-coupling factor transporter transmembrane protein EcfT [Lactobacillus sp. Sy-1]|uniref:energy-coupling factor transporter transmembrane component T family protein n=1 Tax=Lactobacillus sp. Sy-1 TaxID=2109645 RepID=UPI001C57BDEA|nr:energy-coupling factor transporter transmembrane component T [Lactobacillus sp. Sy-1]MBW1605094.1 energy-coupling factor transporter transmembrane protein EcfT [Lactobacillus sp. Sy-1]